MLWFMMKHDLAPLKSFAAQALQVQVHSTGDALAAAAAAEAAECLRAAIQATGQASAIFACAASQVRFLAALIAEPGLDWTRIAVFHMDEYLGIPATHPASFRRFLREHLVDRVRPRIAHWLEGDALEPIAECRRYTRLLRQQPIDLCCLGIGENGHIAFNDPAVADFADLAAVKIVKLDDACRSQQVGEGCFPSLDAVPQYALTLTIPALCAVRRIVGIVPENRKAIAVQQALQGPMTTACPASFLRWQSHATLHLDAQSAGRL